MDKKVLGIVILAIVLTLGIVVAINYNNSSVDRDSDVDEDTSVEEQVDGDKDEDIKVEEDISKQETDEEIKKDNEDKEDAEDLNTDIDVGKPAPDFTLKDLDGKEVSLSDYRGKIVLINFWATWCKFCDIEMPDLNQLDKDNDDVVVLAVDVMEDEAKVKKYIEKGGYDFKVVLDTKGEIARKYLVSSFPTTYAVDKEGNLVSGAPGMMTKEQMERIVESVRESE